MVNHPPHYKTKSGLETIDIIEALVEELDGVEGYNIGNAIKYLSRWKKKGGLQDLEKARWYLNRVIEHIEKNQKSDISHGKYAWGGSDEKEIKEVK